jgi:hypothetical protein
MIALLLACATAPTLTVTCTDSAVEVFRSTCPADAIRINRTRHGVNAACYPYGGLTPPTFSVDADSCRALPEVEGD